MMLSFLLQNKMVVWASIPVHPGDESVPRLRL
jgi:hypothetical protein